jgi:hypothetical protein
MITSRMITGRKYIFDTTHHSSSVTIRLVHVTPLARVAAARDLYTGSVTIRTELKLALATGTGDKRVRFCRRIGCRDGVGHCRRFGCC